jgi:penicillin-binding protein 2
MRTPGYLAQRKYVVGVIFTLVVFIYVARLFYIQIVDDKYKLHAKNNAFHYLTDYAPRGCVYDRNGKLLVYNAASYDLMVVPKLVKGCDTMALCEVLQITREEFIGRIKKACQAPNSPRKQSVFEKQMSPAVYSGLLEKLYRFKGFYVQPRTVRKYPKPVAAHLLGYVNEVSREKTQKDSYYHEGDYIGISGLEKSYEEILRGKKGTRIIIKDVHNKEVGSYMDGLYDTSAIDGKALYSSIDLELQEYGEKLMRGKKGAIVAIEPSTGEILCLVSSPAYDPNLLVSVKDRSRNFSLLSSDTNLMPLYNRALTAMYPPGSTFKLINCLIAQHEGLINNDTYYPCQNGYPAGGGKPKCHTHGGGAKLRFSVSTSCNSYYSYVFRQIVDQKKFKTFTDGYNYWRDLVRTFGPGTSLGSDLPFDKPGNVPSVNYYNRVFGKGRWQSSHVVSLGIGQAELLLVPLQMANVVAIIANKGYYYVPHCIKGVGAERKIDPKFKEKHFVGVQKAEYYENVIEGMEGTMDPGGTAWRSKIKGIRLCGKTGTAQNPHGLNHSEFQAFAPREQPKIAIACIVENSGDGGAFAAPIVSLMVEKYLTGKVQRADFEKRVLETDLIGSKQVCGEKVSRFKTPSILCRALIEK